MYESSEWAKLIFTGIVTFVGSLAVLIFAGGKYADRVEKTEKDIESLKMKVSPDDGIPIIMSVPECLKTQHACQSLVAVKMENIAQELKGLRSSIEKREEKFEGQIREIHKKQEAHISTIYDKISMIKNTT